MSNVINNRVMLLQLNQELGGVTKKKSKNYYKNKRNKSKQKQRRNKKKK